MAGLNVRDINPLSGEDYVNINGDLYVENSVGSLVNVSDYLRLEESYDNLLIESSSIKDVDISYDHMYIGTVRDTQTTPVTIDLSVDENWGSGTAAEPANGWVYIWNWSKADNTTTQYFDLSSTDPDTPSGYTQSRLIGRLYNESNDIRPFRHHNYNYCFTPITAVNAGTETSYSVIALAGTVGDYTQVTDVFGDMYNTTGGQTVYVASTSEGYGEQVNRNGGSGVTNATGTYTLAVMSENIYYKVSSVSGTIRISRFKLKI